MKLIDKDKVVAEVERRLDKLYNLLPDASKVENSNITRTDACNTGKYIALESFRKFIDTLETKEVDLEEEIKVHIDECLDVKFPTTNIELIKKDVEYTARKFFELGLSAQTSTVWHYVSEEIPTKFGNPIIVASLNKNKEDGIWLYDLIQSWEGEWNPRVNWENPVKWAYMDDLLKQKKEE